MYRNNIPEKISGNPYAEIVSAGFPTEKAHLIHTFVGGSTLHGVKVEGTDDRDLYGIFIQHPRFILWDKIDHFITSSAPDDRRNKAGDVDVVCYSLQKFARLAVSGNPTILNMLFTPANAGELMWTQILIQRDDFLAKSHGHKYLGYADAQLKRMTGARGRGCHGQRPELIEEHGYDTKAGMHVLRLLLECIELMNTGRITLPRPADEIQYLLGVRSGKHSEEWVIDRANYLFGAAKEAMAASKLPEEPNKIEVGALVERLYLMSWQRLGR